MSQNVFIMVMIGVAGLVAFSLRNVIKSLILKEKSKPGLSTTMAAAVAAVDEAELRNRSAIDAVAALPPDAGLSQALAAYRAHAPATDLPSDFDHLQDRFQTTAHQPFLGVIGGLVLRHPESSASERIVRDATRTVFEQSTPALAAEFAEAISADEAGPDRWIWLAGEGRPLQSAISRLAPIDADVAARLERLDEALLALRLQREIEEAERQLAFYEGKDRVDSTYEMASQFVSWSLLPTPEMYERFDRLVEANETHFEWRQLRLQMDLILIETGRHRDSEKAFARIVRYLEDEDPLVVETAAETARDLVEQNLAGPAFRSQARAALQRLRARPNAPLVALDQLEAALTASS